MQKVLQATRVLLHNSKENNILTFESPLNRFPRNIAGDVSQRPDTLVLITCRQYIIIQTFLSLATKVVIHARQNNDETVTLINCLGDNRREVRSFTRLNVANDESLTLQIFCIGICQKSNNLIGFPVDSRSTFLANLSLEFLMEDRPNRGVRLGGIVPRLLHSLSFCCLTLLDATKCFLVAGNDHLLRNNA